MSASTGLLGVPTWLVGVSTRLFGVLTGPADVLTRPVGVLTRVVGVLMRVVGVILFRRENASLYNSRDQYWPDLPVAGRHRARECRISNGRRKFLRFLDERISGTRSAVVRSGGVGVAPRRTSRLVFRVLRVLRERRNGFFHFLRRVRSVVIFMA